MNCPSCGRVILKDEICVCKMDAIRQRDMELRRERMEEEMRIQQEEIEVERRRRERERKKKEAAEKLKKSAVNISGDVANSYKEVFSGPFTNLRGFLTDEKDWQSKVLGLIYLLFQSAAYGILFCFTNVSYFLGSRAKISNPSFLKMFLIVFALELVFLILTMVLANIFINREADTDLSETFILYSSGFVFLIPVLLLSSVLALFFPSLSFALLLFGYWIKMLTIYNVLLFKTKKVDYCIFSSLIINGVYIIPQYLAFSILMNF